MSFLFAPEQFKKLIHYSYGEGLTLVQPPSTTNDCPVMCLASSETRNKAVAAMSSTVAGRPIGVMRDQVFVYSGSSNVRSVAVAPGAIALTFIPNGEISITRFLASISSAALVMP